MDISSLSEAANGNAPQQDSEQSVAEELLVDSVTVEREQWEQLQTEFEQLKNQLLRTQADFDNFRKRTRQEREELAKTAARNLLSELLPVLDSFDRALTSIAADVTTVPQSLREGIEMVHRQFVYIMNSQGVQAMEVEGQPFNPNVHQAVMQDSVEGTEPGVVVQELQKGYWLHDKVLRPAMVKVSM
ncbi:nucleotide exchange factor GrpE [Alicyclobacillaceae bacterium I2511]|nr:nucleotide exchange factor GrpE [Alicyclobacillaceae bacterium I2511]